MPIKKVTEFLDENGVRYRTITHSKAYTAQEVAASAHVPGKELAKTVIVKLDGKKAMAVLPASYRIVTAELADLAGAEKAEIASEGEFKELFPECEIGAMPPFGNLYDLDVFVAEPLPDDDEIAFNAGTHTELIQLPYSDFERLVSPKVGRFGKRE